MAGTMGDIHTFKHLHHLLFAFGLLAVQIDKGQFYVFIDRQFVNQVEVLEYKADIPLTERSQLALAHLIDLLSVEEVFARSRRIKRSQNIQQGGLAATRRPHDSHKLAFLYLQAYFIQCFGLYVFRGEEHRQVLCFNHMFLFINYSLLKIYIGFRRMMRHTCRAIVPKAIHISSTNATA